MIDFNDACRYQNFLKSMFSKVCRHIMNDDFVVTTVKTHHKSDACKTAEDTIEVSKNPFDDENITPNKMIKFGLAIIDEREKLAEAISFAKAQADLQIDAACMINKDKMLLASYLGSISDIKTKESESNGTAYVMNEIDGKQTPYVYKVSTVKKINFDRNFVKGVASRLKKEMKETSKEIERFNLDVQVDFEPRWSEDDTLEDILNNFEE